MPAWQIVGNEMFDEPRLADTGFAHHQDCTALAGRGPVELRPQYRQFGAPPVESGRMSRPSGWVR